MFDRPGKTLKRLALIDFITLVIASFVFAVVFSITETRYDIEFDFLKFILILLGGCSGAYVTAIGLYAFGELVDSTEKNADATCKLLTLLENENSTAIDSAEPYKNTNFNDIPSASFETDSHAIETTEMWTCTYCRKKNKASDGFCERCSMYRKR